MLGCHASNTLPNWEGNWGAGITLMSLVLDVSSPIGDFLSVAKTLPQNQRNSFKCDRLLDCIFHDEQISGFDRLPGCACLAFLGSNSLRLVTNHPG